MQGLKYAGLHKHDGIFKSDLESRQSSKAVGRHGTPERYCPVAKASSSIEGLLKRIMRPTTLHAQSSARLLTQ